ncbi:MAG TPA: choice-of-anchor A family protein [Ignavibacteriales bacterium]|nr:choice-of-anchor A family protein [Ignavibacteriales bacterium]
MKTLGKVSLILLFLFIAIHAQSYSINSNNTTIVLKTLGTWNSLGVPNYLVAPNDVIPNTLIQRIQATLPERKNLFTRKPEIIQDYQVILSKQADVYVTYVTEQAGYRNVLGFYTYDKNNPPATINDIANIMTIIFPNASNYNSGGGLLPGNKVKIGTFPANTVIGFFIIANGWNGSQVTSGNWWLFSNSKFNPEANDTLKKHFVLFNDEPTGKIILAFEDIRNDQGSDKDFNDCIFYVTTNPIDAANNDSLPNTDPETKLNYADLQISKSVNKNNPNNGDNITYTVSVKNNGPDKATNVKISDVLPKGVIFNSYNASQETFDVQTGLWNVGTLLKNQSATLNINCTVDLFQNGANFGLGRDFNLIVFGDINQPSSDVEGRLAVQGDAYLDKYSVGYKLTHTSRKKGESLSPDALIVGNNLIFLGGAVYGGNVVYGGTTNLPTINVGIYDGQLIRDTARFDFVTAKNQILTLSNQLSNYKSNGNVKFIYGALTLTGKNPYLNIFNINGDTLSQANTVNVNAPNGSVVVVNIKGKNISWTGDHTVNGTAYGNVLYNFYEAERLNISGIAVLGSIIAPNAELEFPSGVIKGQVFVKNMYGSGQFNWDPFIGNIPVSQVVDNEAKVLSLGETDTVATNDKAKIQFVVNAIEDPDVVPGNANVVWQSIGQFTEDDIVWDMKLTTDNKILAGTWGGNIYRFDRNGQNKVLLLNDTSVNFIWSLLIDGSTYYAAYEKGIVYSTNGGIDWQFVGDLNIKNNDVRSLLKVNNKLFAAVWGKGIFVSTDNGITWSKSGDIEVEAVQALAKDSKNNIYAATFGGGIFKSTDLGANWNKLDISYRHIWCLGVDNSDNVFAGSFGNGVYYSSNEGNSWTILNNSLTGEYIYSITVDDSNRVFASAWNNGIYQVNVNNSNPNSMPMVLGLKGVGVTSIFYDNDEIYAATENGNLYVLNLKKVVGIKNSNDNKKYNFNLQQNYPNPFNPGTKISFEIPTSGNVVLKIYDINGKEVSTLINKFMSAGSYSVDFNASDLTTGVYFYRLSLGNSIMTKKMILVK